MRALAIVLSRYRPLGRSLDAVSNMERLFKSELMLDFMFGYWILTATGYGAGIWFGWFGFRGSEGGMRCGARVAEWTCPIEAAAMGVSLKDWKRERQSGPRVCWRIGWSWEEGM